MPKVSVVMLAYNNEKYIGQAIESILNQTFQDFELIIIDDASIDNTKEVIKKYQDKRIRLIEQRQNQGIPRNRNLGLTLAKGEYMATLDSDDISRTDRFYKQVALLENRGDIAVVGSDSIVIDEKGNQLRYNPTPSHSGYIQSFFMLGNCMVTSSTMVRRSFIEAYNIHFNESYYYGEDYDFFMKIILKGKITNINEALVDYRVGHINTTAKVTNDIKKDKLIFDLKKKYIQELGYTLCEGDYILLDSIYGSHPGFKSNKEIQQLYEVFKKLLEQAKLMKVAYYDQLLEVLRRRFGDRIASYEGIWTHNNKQWYGGEGDYRNGI